MFFSLCDAEGRGPQPGVKSFLTTLVLSLLWDVYSNLQQIHLGNVFGFQSQRVRDAWFLLPLKFLYVFMDLRSNGFAIFYDCSGA